VRQIGEGDLRALQGETGLLQGFVRRAETLGPRVEGIHCACDFSSCWHLHSGEHLALQPQSLHCAQAGAVAMTRRPRKPRSNFMTTI
jgi:hypothetical protein